MGGSKRSSIAREAKADAEAQILEYKKQQEEQQVILDKQKQEYKDIQFENPYAENVFEDLTVNQQQAQFQAQQGAQQRANIMQGLKGAAGGSGIAGLAQAMANQGQLQTQQISASIGEQEAMNQKLMAQGAQQRQTGEAMVQQAESGRTSTLLGMEYGEMAGIRQAQQQAEANKMSALGLEAEMEASRSAMQGQITGAVIGGVATIGAAMIMSDRDLKKDVKKIGKSNTGVNIYEFKFRNPKRGTGTYQGVMADDLPKKLYNKAVSKNKDGLEIVDYSKLDVQFKQI